MAIDGNTTGETLLPQLQKKHRLQHLSIEYVFELCTRDQERLHFECTDLKTKLLPLNVTEVTLVPKRYADSPTSLRVGRISSSDTKSSVTESVHPEIMLNETTAAMYKEWKVIKTNKYGKKQHRILGIDANTIYNKKVDGETRSSLTKTVRTITSNRVVTYYCIRLNEG